MADKQTMQDHIEDLMIELNQTRERLRDAEENARLYRAAADALISERDALEGEVMRLRSVARRLVEAADIQMSLSTVPVSFTKVIHTQHWKDALAAYEEVLGDE